MSIDMQIDDLIEGYRDEANIDFISLGAIVADVKIDLEIDDPKEIMTKSIQIVKALMERGVFPGNYTLESLRREGFSFWPGTPDELIRRIQDAWIVLNRTPDLDDICWFALKPSGKA